MNSAKKIEDILKNAGIEEYKKEAQILIEEISGLKKEDLLLDKKIENFDEIIEIAKKRAETKLPIQYLLGYSYFMNEKYKVDENVLIPRDETEILVLEAYKKIKDKIDKIDILDIGTGSGCISCALAKKLKNKNVEILAVDISLGALKTALENVIALDLVKKVVLRKSDLFSKVRDIEKFDLIISNPPYIPLSQENNLQKEVSFEPKSALFALDNEGVEFYKKIIDKAPQFLKDGGYIAFELGINQSARVKKFLEQDFCDIDIIKDLAGIDRVILAKKK